MRTPAEDRGSATVEFVAVAVMVLTPLMYLVLAVSEVQREVFATTQAAREAGRAFQTAAGWQEGAGWAEAAARLSYQDHDLAFHGVTLSLADSPQDCSQQPQADLDLGGTRPLADGTVMCVRKTVRLPGVPAFLDAGRNTVAGAYVMHFSDFRERR